MSDETGIYRLRGFRKLKLFDGTLELSGWFTSSPFELGDFEDVLFYILNQGNNSLNWYLQACIDVNDPDWYSWAPVQTLTTASGVFESLQYPWGAIRLRLRCVNTSGTTATVWASSRIRE